MNIQKLRKLLAVVLALAMTLSAGVCAFADETESVKVNDETVTVNGNITVTVDDWETGSALSVSSYGSDENSVATVNGTITEKSGDYPYSTAVDVTAYDGGTAQATVQDINAEGGESATGAYVQASDGGTASLAAGEITAESDGFSKGLGVYAYSDEDSYASAVTEDITAERGVETDANQGTTEITVAGDVNAEEFGVYAQAFRTGSAEVEIEGDVNAGRTGVEANSNSINEWIPTEEFDAALSGLTLMWSEPIEVDESEKEYIKSITYEYYEDADGHAYSRYVYEEVGGDVWYSCNKTFYDCGTVTVKVGGDLTVEGEDAMQLIHVYSESPEGAAAVTVGGDAVLKRDEENVEESAIQVSADDGGLSTVTVEGSVTSNAVTGLYEYGWSEGTELNAEIGGDLNVATEGLWSTGVHQEVYTGAAAYADIGGDLNVSSENYGATGLFIENRDSTSSASVGGDVVVGASEFANGVQHSTSYESEASTYVGGDLTVYSENDGAVGVTIENVNSADSVTVGGNVTVTAETYATGVYADSAKEDAGDAADAASTVDVCVGGDITATSLDGMAWGVNTYAYSEGETTTIVDGSVLASGKEEAFGVYAWSDTDGTVLVDVSGDVTAYSDGLAAGVQARTTDGTVGVFAEGDVVASGEYGKGIEAEVYDEGGSVSVYAGGDVYAYGEESATGIQTYNDGGIVTVAVLGDVVSEDTGIVMDGEGESTTDVFVGGDVTAEGTAVSIDVENDTAAMNLLIDGSVSGEHSIVLTEQTVTDNLTLTVWEVVPNEAGNLIERETDNGYEADEEAEKQMQYIIRVDGNNLSTEGTTEYEGYDVAHEGDTVILKVNVPAGYVLSGAFNGTDTKVTLEKNADGQYYLVVPRGGAVLLSVTMYKSEEAKKKDITNAVSAAAGDEAVSVEVVKDPETKQNVVVVKPEEGAENVDLTLDSKAVKTLLSNGASQLSVQTADGTAQADVSIKELKAALDKAPDSELIIDMNDDDEGIQMPETVKEQYDVIPGGIDVIKIVLKDKDGNETEVPDVKITLKLQVEYQQGMMILFIDGNGNATEAETEWVEATETAPGYARVVYQGYGSYLPVMPK